MMWKGHRGGNGGLLSLSTSSSSSTTASTTKLPTTTSTDAASTPATGSTTTATLASNSSQQPISANTTNNIYSRTHNRGPVSWQSLFLIGVAAASAVAYYQIERERRLEQAMGKIVSSELDGSGWTPRPDYLAKRKFIPTKYGWFPMADAFGARELTISFCFPFRSYDLFRFSCFVIIFPIYYNHFSSLFHWSNFLMLLLLNLIFLNVYFISFFVTAFLICCFFLVFYYTKLFQITIFPI
jgi:hypothetical protein